MRPILVTARAAAVWLLALAVVTAAGAAQDAPDSSTGESAAFAQPDSRAALNEGNRRFRDGQIEAAVEAYLRGYSPAAPHPTLLYNLGTALHHLDRLPEAILWYRRAAESDDLWLKDNLLLARRSLGSQIPGGLFSPLPTNPRTNISGGALGLFQVSAVASDEIKIE